MPQRQKELKTLEDEAAGIRIASDEDTQSYVQIRKVRNPLSYLSGCT